MWTFEVDVRKNLREGKKVKAPIRWFSDIRCRGRVLTATRGGAGGQGQGEAEHLDGEVDLSQPHPLSCHST